MSVFVHAQGIKTVNAGGGDGGVKKWQNYVHVVVECPLIGIEKILTCVQHNFGLLRNYFDTSSSHWCLCFLHL